MKRNYIRISREEAKYLVQNYPVECTPDEAELYSRLRKFVKNGF